MPYRLIFILLQGSDSTETPILTPRLRLIADLVKPNSIIADVGTDHGYIPVYLTLTGVCPLAYAGDINEGPLENAKNTVKKYGVEGKVITLLSAGLEEFPKNKADTVIIAGMGGDQIADIVKEAKWVHSKDVTLILQPMTMHDRCRRLLALDGFVCEKEEYVKEGDRLYTVMVYRNSHIHEIDEVTAHIGLANKSESPLAQEYIARRIEKLNRMAEGMEKSLRQSGEAASLRDTVKKLLNSRKCG